MFESATVDPERAKDNNNNKGGSGLTSSPIFILVLGSLPFKAYGNFTSPWCLGRPKSSSSTKAKGLCMSGSPVAQKTYLF